jgi:16S rRNA (guanine(1405)-N(7))-methyltransferase
VSGAPPAGANGSGGEGEPAAAVAAEALRSRRYRWVAPELVERLAGEALIGSRRPADAVKRLKRRLHQICGAYVWEVRPDAVLAELRGAQERSGPEGLRAACRRALARHASTRERLPVIEDFYRAIFARTGPPGRVLDLACGLGPLAWPWMGLPAQTGYVAYDVDRRLVELVDGALTLCGVGHVAALRDVIGRPPEEPADVALLLKAAPCLEQQDPGGTRRMLGALRARRLVVSFPTRSLGGADRGMRGHYRAQLDAIVAGTPWEPASAAAPERIDFPLETVYLLGRG